MTMEKDASIDLTTGAGDETAADKSVGELIQQLATQTSDLVREEIALAQVELKEKGRRAGMGAGLFGGAGAIAFYAGGALIATIILGLSEVMWPWLAALIVTVVLFVVAGVLALVGKKKVEQATPLVPKRAILSTKESVQSVKGRARR